MYSFYFAKEFRKKENITVISILSLIYFHCSQQPILSSECQDQYVYTFLNNIFLKPDANLSFLEDLSNVPKEQGFRSVFVG